jgi:hypothetical protein
MTNNDTRRIASYLLPDPGGEVVRAMLDEMDSLRARVAELGSEVESLRNDRDSLLLFGPGSEPDMEGKG